VLECVEISPEVVEASLKYFGHINLGAEQERLAKITFADGRNYVRLAGGKYDVIMSDPINPIIAENGSLYSLEFFGSVRERLNPGGLFLYWLPLHLPRDVIESILATTLRAYPRVTLWTVPIAGGTFVQVVCSVSEQRFAPRDIDRALVDRRVKTDMDRIGIPCSATFMAYYRGDEHDVIRLVGGARLNTDDHPVVEFAVNRARFKDTAPLILELVGGERRESMLRHIDWREMSAEEKTAWLERYRLSRLSVLP
jgi:spermidine synthase